MRALLLLFILNFAHADELSGRLEKIVKGSAIARAKLGLVVIDVAHANHKTLFDVNAEQPFIPASVSKLATASTVLQKLGPSFKFQTTLWSGGVVKDGTLHGDLVLKGGGDPGFVSETMWFLVNEFTRTGIKAIDGNILVDDTDFDQVREDQSRDPERVDRAYDAPVGAMSFNWNSINIFIRPTETGEAPQVILDPLPDYFTVDNKAKTTNKAGSDLQISRVGGRVVVRGAIGIEHPEQAVFKNIDDPADWAGRGLQAFLSQRGIRVSGTVKMGKRPETAKLYAKADSRPLSSSVTDMMKFSNNYVAEMLTKNLAAQNGTVPATLEAGMKIIRAHLVSDVGLDAKNFTLLNPSGLSRKNRMRPRDLAEILLQAQINFPTFAEFLTALPLAGLDGTLKKRMTSPSVQGWVRAKTGSLTGAVALAGFAGRKDGETKAFAFIYNGGPGQDESARHLFDQLAAALVQ